MSAMTIEVEVFEDPTMVFSLLNPSYLIKNTNQSSPRDTMLKRQRPVSPPPTFSSVPLIVTEPPAELVGRNTKRRRTLPPVLDGAYRGWAQAPPLPINNVEDDEEDYISDDEVENIAPNFSINCSLTQLQQPEDKAEYTSTNNVLRELHTLQQHRLLFSSLPLSVSSRSSNLKDAPHASNILSHSGYSSPLNKGQFNLLPQLPIERPRSPIAKFSQQQGHAFPINEMNSITEHYEGTNKYVVLQTPWQASIDLFVSFFLREGSWDPYFCQEDVFLICQIRDPSHDRQ